MGFSDILDPKTTKTPETAEEFSQTLHEVFHNESYSRDSYEENFILID
jgi:hypothetical protein